MAKVTAIGKALVITSAVKLDDIKTVVKYRPDSLVLYEGEGEKKEPVFAIGTGTSGNINKFGANFDGKNTDGFAQLTMFMDIPEGEDIKGVIADEIGGAILNLGKLEEKLPGVIDEIAAEKAAIQANIEVAQ